MLQCTLDNRSLDEHLKASGMKLAEFQRIFTIFTDGNPAVDYLMLWEYRIGLSEEKSRSCSMKIMADLYMLAQDTKIGVPTPEKLEKGFKHPDKIQLEGMAHGDFGHVFGLFVEQWAGTFQSIIRAIARGSVSRAGFMTAIYDRTGSEHSILRKGETIPSIERRLKWKDGLHPGNGSIGILGDEDSYVFIEMLKKYFVYMFNSVATSGNQMIAQLKRMGMHEATDALQKATVVVQALEYLEQNFSSAATRCS